MPRLARVRHRIRAWGAGLAVIGALAIVPRVAPAQATGRDTSRTVILDSVQKTFGAPLDSTRRAGLAGDLSRTVDAEVRVAMFEMASGETLPAMSRLERLSSLVDADTASVGAPERSALHFLLSQSYYRLGMMTSFRREAEAAMQGGRTRYASVLGPQLMVEAYRTGDYARAASLASELPAADATDPRRQSSEPGSC